jgi:hypothetical protein
MYGARFEQMSSGRSASFAGVIHAMRAYTVTYPIKVERIPGTCTISREVEGPEGKSL